MISLTPPAGRAGVGAEERRRPTWRSRLPAPLLLVIFAGVSSGAADRRMLPNMGPPRDSGRRLTADDWIEAGFAVLADSGPNALRIDRLCERLEVSKDSFYWHVTDLSAYRGALIEAWGSLHDRSRRQFEHMPDVEPRQRLTVMIQTWVAPQHWQLERAMRVWALTDDAVRASVQQSDGRVLSAIRQAFVDCGFAPDD